MYQKEYFVPANPNTYAYQSDLTPYALKTDVTTDLSLYALKTDVTTDLAPYALKTDVSTELVPYALKTDVATDLVPYALKTDVTADLIPYALKTDVTADLVPYALKTDVNAELVPYALKTDVATDLIPYALKTDVANDLVPYALKTDVTTDLIPYALATRPITYLGDTNVASDLTQTITPNTIEAMKSLRFSTMIYQGTGEAVFALTQPVIPPDDTQASWNTYMPYYTDTTPWDLEIFNNSYTHNSNFIINPPPATSDLTFICTPALPITLPAKRMATIRQINRTTSGSSPSTLSQSVQYIITLSA